MTYRYPTQAEVDWLRSGDGRTAPTSMTRSQFMGLKPTDQAAFARAGLIPLSDPKPVPAPLKDNQISRKNFDDLSPVEQREAARKFAIVDVD
jgi:hypothetical protein